MTVLAPARQAQDAGAAAIKAEVTRGAWLNKNLDMQDVWAV